MPSRSSVALESTDQHDRLLADNPAIVTGIDCHDLRHGRVDDASVGVFDVDLAREESDVGVHAAIGDDRLHRF
jgi:hypothetical protein